MPRNDPLRVVLWHRAGAMLAAGVADVVEVAYVEAGGEAVCRDGRIPLHVIPGLRSASAAPRAIIVRHEGEHVALPADQVEGVMEADSADVADPPAWLRSLDTRHVRGLVRLADERLAALLELDALLGTS